MYRLILKAGVWVSVEGYRSGTLQITGTASVTVMGRVASSANPEYASGEAIASGLTRGINTLDLPVDQIFLTVDSGVLDYCAINLSHDLISLANVPSPTLLPRVVTLESRAGVIETQNLIGRAPDFTYATLALMNAASPVNGVFAYVLETKEYFERAGGVWVSRGAGALRGDYQVLNRTALIAYSGLATTLIVQTGSATGVWSRDDAATVDGGTVLSGTAPRRWVKQYQVLRLRDFGVIGDLIVDDTANLQAALTFAAAAKIKLYGENLRVRITAPVTAPAGTSLDFDYCGYMWGDPGIHVDFASATPGITFSPGAHNIGRLGVYGQRVRVSHGILLNNALLSTFDKLRVHGFQGSGLEIRQTWDSTFGSISAELCGSATSYAVAITDGADTSNMLNIQRLQVEQSVQQALYISPNLLSSVINNIHAERQTPATGKVTFVLGGNRTQYNSLRLQCLQVGAVDVGTVSFEGGSLTVANPLIEDGFVSVIHDAAAGEHTVLGGRVLPPVQAKVNQTGTIEYHGSDLTELKGQGGSVKVFGGKIGTFRPGFCTATDPAAQFFLSGVKITTVTGADSNARARLADCTIGGFDPGQAAFIELDGCTVTGNARVAYGIYKLTNTTVNGTLTIDYARLEMQGGGANAMTFAAGGRVFNFRDVAFTTPDLGANGIPTGGAWIKNQRHDNINPAVLGAAASQYIVTGWLCTVSGTPGTWVEQRTLTGT